MATQYNRSSTVTAELAASYLPNRDQDVMQALVTAGALIAAADGRVESVERDELLNYIDRQRFVPTISRASIAKAFDKRVRELKDRDSASVIVEAFRPLAGLSREVQAFELIRLIMMTLPTSRPSVALRS